MTVTRTWQLELNGVRMGAETAYRMRSTPEGLGMPSMRTNDLPWLSVDGAYGAGDYLQPRLVRAQLAVMGSSPANAEQLARTLVGAWRPSRSDVTLHVRLAGSDAYRLTGRPRRCELDMSTLASSLVTAAVEFAALDPYLYAADVSGGTIQLGSGSTTPGVIPNLTFDLEYQPAGTPSPGVVYANNAGSAPTYPSVTFTGPVDTPRLENRTTGQTLELNTTLVGGDQLVVNNAARTVTLNGTSALQLLDTASQWLELAPGANEVAYRSADATPTTSTALTTWRSAWY